LSGCLLSKTASADLLEGASALLSRSRDRADGRGVSHGTVREDLSLFKVEKCGPIYSFNEAQSEYCLPTLDSVAPNESHQAIHILWAFRQFLATAQPETFLNALFTPSFESNFFLVGHRSIEVKSPVTGLVMPGASDLSLNQ
jgi:hypothetical protein